jgi:hypothetical protein
MSWYSTFGSLDANYGTCYSNVDLIYFFEGDGGNNLGITSTCNVGGDIAYAAVKVFKDPWTWFKGPNENNIGAGDHDLQSLIAHEIGHANGTFYPNAHYGVGGVPNAGCPTGGGSYVPGDHVMCLGFDEADTHGRVLKSHDEDTFAAWY